MVAVVPEKKNVIPWNDVHGVARGFRRVCICVFCEGLAIDQNPAAGKLYGVTRQTDHSLDETPLVTSIGEDHDVSSARAPEQVTDHKHVIARKEGRFHRRRRHEERLRDVPQRERDENHEGSGQ
jgi:hypothetical protein